MSDRPRAGTRYTLEANLPESFFTASPSRESGRMPLGEIFREIKELPAYIYLPYLPQLKGMRRERGWCNGWLRRDEEGEGAKERV